MSAHSSICGVIGNTPSVWLDRLTARAGVRGRILAKLDYLNPGFSKKDRAALGIIQAARDSGALRDGQVVVELELLKGPEQGGTIGVVICDSGLKYLSTDLWPE